LLISIDIGSLSTTKTLGLLWIGKSPKLRNLLNQIVLISEPFFINNKYDNICAYRRTGTVPGRLDGIASHTAKQYLVLLAMAFAQNEV